MLERYLKKKKFNDYEDFLENFEILIPENFNFGYDVVDLWAKIDPKRIALKCVDTNGGIEIFTFAQIKKISDFAAGFFQKIGIGKGDFVMLLLKNQYQWWICMVALHKLGAIAIPTPYSLSSEDIKYRCNEIPIKAIIAIGNKIIIDNVEKAIQDCRLLKHLISVGPIIPKNWIDFMTEIRNQNTFNRPDLSNTNDDTMIVFFTSGTTGLPKMVAHDFVYPLSHLVTAYWQNIEKDSVLLTLSDTGWGKSVWGKLYGQWLLGATILVYDFEYFIPQELFKIIEDNKVTAFCAPPIFYRLICSENLCKFNLSNLKYCCVAGEKLDVTLYNKWKQLTGISLKEGYGQTETALIIANFPFMLTKPGSIGKRNPLYNVSIVNENEEICKPGEYGEIVIDISNNKPIGLLKCYINDTNLTNEILNNRFYHTGDIGYEDDDGYYWFISRKDDIIKTSGYRIGPYEVETACLSHIAVEECLVTSVEDPIRGQIIKAIIVLTKDFRGTATDDLKKQIQIHVKRVTAPYKCPRIIEFVDKLPIINRNNYKKIR